MTDIETSIDLGGLPVEEFLMMHNDGEYKLSVEVEDGREFGFNFTEKQLERLSESSSLILEQNRD